MDLLFSCLSENKLRHTHCEVKTSQTLNRGVFLDGVRNGVWTAHSVVLCFMFGPLGLLSHWLTKAAARLLGRGAPQEPEYIMFRF